jgi:hypothetical protein
MQRSTLRRTAPIELFSFSAVDKKEKTSEKRKVGHPRLAPFGAQKYSSE